MLSVLLIVLFVLLTVNSINAENVTDIVSSDSNDTALNTHNDISNTMGSTSVNTFTSLSTQINETDENTTLSLKGYYKYNKEIDGNLTEGIGIFKNMTIIGYDACIDGNNFAKGLYIAPNCTVVLKNIIFKNCYGETNGGALNVENNCNITIINCTFFNNMVYNANGGAVSVRSGSIVDVYSTIFSNNTSIRVSDLEWKEFKRGMGSAICASLGVQLSLYNSTFKNNDAYLATVLLVSYSGPSYNMSTLYVNGCLFDSNVAPSSVAIYLDELGRGKILNTVFRNNRADKGGTLVLDACLSALVENCSFEGNSALKGGAIQIKVFEYVYRSNVTIKGCNFTKNKASQQGGAVYAKYGLTKIINCNFNENYCEEGGAVFTKFATVDIANCTFNKNSAGYGGALLLKSDSNNVANSIFTSNTATIKGGAIYSKMEQISYSNCVCSNNNAPIGVNIYGVFVAQVTEINSYFGEVSLSIKLSSPWNVPLSQKIKLTFKGDHTYKTGWLKTDSNGHLTVEIPLDIDAGKYTLTITMEGGVCYINPTISVVKAPSKLFVNKLSAKYNSGKIWKFYAKNTKTGKKIPYAKLYLHVYTGKKYTTYKATSNSKGWVKFDTSKLPIGNHKVKIVSQNKNIKLSKTKTSINIKKGSAKASADEEVEKSSKLEVTVKSGDNVIKKTKFQLKYYSGGKLKIIKVKTNSNGVFKISTKKLSKGSHNFVLLLKNNKYNVNSKFTVKVI